MLGVLIKMCNSIEEAPNYAAMGGYKLAKFKEAVVVKAGTEGGNPTVDLVFEDESGNKFVAMTTGALVKSIAHAVGSTTEHMV